MIASPRIHDRGSIIVEIAAAIVLIAAAIIGGLLVPRLVSGWAFAMPGTTDTALSPTFFPYVAMVLLGLAALNMAITAPFRQHVLPFLEMSASEWRRTACVTAMIIAYFIGMRAIGFMLASTLFVMATTLMLGYRKYLRIVAVGLLAPLAIGLGFRFGLNVILPSGVFGVGF